ncbi:hypothetical protein ACS0TY_035066 [Phlomoides rotata]
MYRWSIRLGKTESLISFLKRFNQAAFEVPTVYPEVKINAPNNGPKDGDLFSSLVKKPVETFDELLRRADKYITLEEVLKAKNIDSKSSVKSKLSTPEPVASRSGFRRKYDRYTPLKLEHAKVLQVALDHPEIRLSYSRSRGPLRPKSDRFCRFHNEYENDTNNCFHLKDDIERMIQAINITQNIKLGYEKPRKTTVLNKGMSP